MSARDELLDRLIAERYLTAPAPYERNSTVQKLDPTDTEANITRRCTELLAEVETTVITPEAERKRAKITNHRRLRRVA